jgi:hypothetical protein
VMSILSMTSSGQHYRGPLRPPELLELGDDEHFYHGAAKLLDSEASFSESSSSLRESARIRRAECL